MPTASVTVCPEPACSRCEAIVLFAILKIVFIQEVRSRGEASAETAQALDAIDAEM